MAVSTTTGSFIRQYNAFTGLSATERSQSGIARAEIVYYNVNDNWGAPGAGNNRVYQTGVLDLPKDFGYVLTDAYCRLDASNNIAVGAKSILRIFVGGILGPQVNVELTAEPDRQAANGLTPIGDITAAEFNSTFLGSEYVMIHSMKNKPTPILYPFGSNAYTSASNPATQWDWKIGEESQGSSLDIDMTCYFRFLQYDIDQSYNYVIQSPQLTR